MPYHPLFSSPDGEPHPVVLFLSWGEHADRLCKVQACDMIAPKVGPDGPIRASPKSDFWVQNGGDFRAAFNKY
ncbi:hypothetical protein SOQ14_02050 [Erythrobacter sp. T5W1-R]|uniref:hypothetical protein n=1 Tax=Erythrobacter sp. T5W1-R TaxID=3101752 RepID=UPI002AFE98CF|nr:hypothetical protein [Erythrobacter sp. T5W1-R]MEA1617689.1 hypothetical protein [Erythrobacter sp. T5W1-R]